MQYWSVQLDQLGHLAKGRGIIQSTHDGLTGKESTLVFEVIFALGRALDNY
jgi:hypothetical protein